jgi:succinyl-diaminopimelate desuccinylase
VSADPRRGDDVRAAGRWLADRLRGDGAEVRLLGDQARPTVVGDFGPVTRGGPVVVVYGHYDVQPPGPGWTSPPFEPRLTKGMLVARGASDDKGQLLAHVVAAEAWRATGGLPVRLLVVAEGAEEIGSPGLLVALREVARTVRPDLVVVSDTRRLTDRVPAVTVSQRGLVSAGLRVEVGGSPVHAGRRGGAVVDPGVVLAEALSRLAAVLPRAVPPAAVRHDVVTLSDRRVRAEVAPRATHASHLDDRITRCVSLHIVRLSSGGSASAVPTSASARLDIRVPPGTGTDRVVEVVRRVLDDAAVPGVALRLDIMSAEPGVELHLAPHVGRVVDAACLTGFGAPAARVRSGGSLPAAGQLRTAFGVDPVLLGLGPPEDGAHGPDEHLDLEGWRRGVLTSTALLGRCVEALPPRTHLGQDTLRHRAVTPRIPARRSRHASLSSNSADRTARVPPGGTA